MRRYAALLAALIALAAVLAMVAAAPEPALAAPANDNFANAITVTTPAVSGIIATGTNVGATTEAGEPTVLTGCTSGNTTTGATVWYTWTSPGSSGTVVFDTYGSDFDTVLGVFTGSPVNALTLQACNDDFGSSLRSGVALTYAPITTYRIQVGGFGGATGTVVLNMSLGADVVVNNAGDTRPDGAAAEVIVAGDPN